MSPMRLLIAVLLALLSLAVTHPSSSVAQTAPAAPSTPAARPADVASEDAILAALYDVISGPAGQKRDWDRMRSIFLPGARLIPTGARAAGGFGSRVMTVDDYITSSGPYLEKEGFFEREIARRMERFGPMVHVWSTYEARHKTSDPTPFLRGINSIQLFNDGTRWWVVSVFWAPETAAMPLPSSYLRSVID
ncbi:MAG: hypothetical protein H0V06_03375 [Gemmatimonadetes bacterium]|nr:hypothetical protein [Gemmatimonadota bacterium]